MTDDPTADETANHDEGAASRDGGDTDGSATSERDGDTAAGTETETETEPNTATGTTAASTPGDGAAASALPGEPDRDREHDDDRARLIERLQGVGVAERATTAAALRAVPRHEFVPEGRREAAYVDRPLPIGGGQTVSAPHMVARMTDLLALDAGDRVLEIGTGCGYHAAVTAAIVGDGNVYSVEFDPDLAAAARERLDRLGYDVTVRTGDGRDGWADHAPYDAAYLTCAPRSVPDAIVEQIRPAGVVVAPVGDRRQELVRLRRRADGGVDRETFGGVRFVPMRG
jgi:protein-L-isoaspartate(D-aspartate) O-methyltransferase